MSSLYLQCKFYTHILVDTGHTSNLILVPYSTQCVEHTHTHITIVHIVVQRTVTVLLSAYDTPCVRIQFWFIWKQAQSEQLASKAGFWSGAEWALDRLDVLGKLYIEGGGRDGCDGRGRDQAGGEQGDCDQSLCHRHKNDKKIRVVHAISIKITTS